MLVCFGVVDGHVVVELAPAVAVGIAVVDVTIAI